MRVVLETARLRLRELTPADLDFVAEMFAHPEVMRFYPKCYTREEMAAWLDRQLQRYADHGHGFWLAEDRGSGQPRGTIGLLPQEVEGQLHPEIGYLLHRPFWGQGLAIEAATGVRDFAFASLRKPYVISLIRPENVPSQRVARRLGMIPWRQVLFKDLVHVVYGMKEADVRRSDVSAEERTRTSTP